ncbi:MAG: family 10 glycosylhydrolase [Planctomycetes bacterium]|nr:family 10 glycosylhydrolase [Planctomycetota bacterium]MCH9726309.1 family 10 glycosylhydrolase [Planctomycetota bacterium]MCH9776413.1 family 10 glycosylhydrolase [Planctomycetota bacterium]
MKRPLTLKLRVEWGEQTPRLWNARFDLTGGKIRAVRSLGVDADEAAVISQAGQKVLYQPRTNRVFNSIEFQIEGDSTTKLHVFIQDQNDSHISVKHQYSLTDILKQKKILPIHQTNSQLMVQQAPGDSFALKMEHPHLVFTPNEMMHLRAFPKYLLVTGSSAGTEIYWTLYRSRSRDVISSGSNKIPQLNQNDLVKQGIPISINAPVEGVYDLEVNMQTGQQAVVQFVVVSPQANHSSHLVQSDNTLQLVDAIELSGFQSHHTLVARRPRTRIRKSFKSLFKAVPQAEETSSQFPPWSAYHLKIRNRNQPHKLVVTYPQRSQTQLGFSILEPDAAGQLVPVGVDSGVYQTNSGLSEVLQTDSQELSTEILFWPRVTNPILLFHGLGTSVPAEITRVQVYELPASAKPPSIQKNSQPEKKRMVGPYMQKPLLPEIFGATQVLDSISNRSLDDWQTFYEAGTRLAYYLNYHHFNSVLLAVSADGSSIYPSRFLSPTPRYDSGIYHSSGQDTARKDILEMLFRIFDREQMALIPELQFSSILTNLEQEIRGQPEKAVGIELVNHHGQSWRDTKVASRGQAPFYNPLNPTVQLEIAKIFQELVNRYKSHSSFQGVAVQLTLNGYLQLPGLKWGYDDLTVSQFEKETGVRVPVAPESLKYEARYQFLTTKGLPQWTKWRCRKIRELHQRLAEILSKERPDTQLIFSASELLPAQSKAGDVVSSLNSGAQFRPVLKEMGLDFSDYDQFGNSIILRPGQFYSEQHKASVANIKNNHPTIDDAFKTRENGALYYHHPVELRISEFDEISPWQPAFTWLVSQASPAGLANRQRYIHTIATMDPYLIFDGGWTIPFGQEQATQSIRTQLQKLPARPFQTIKNAEQPVIARLSRGKDKTYFYLINDFPYPCQLTVEVAITNAADIIDLETNENVKTDISSNGTKSYLVSLDAFDFQAFEVQDSQVQIKSVKCRVNQSDLAHLQAQIDQKRHQLLDLHRSKDDDSTIVFQADFESHNSRDYILAGWESKNQNQIAWNLDSTESHSGKSSLLLGLKQGNSSLKTNEIPLHQSRYLNMSVWLKTNTKEMQVRIALEAEQNGKLKTQSAMISVDRQWRKYLFRVKDIPSDQIQNAHIMIEKLGSGKLWIDDVDLQIHQISPEDDRQLTKLVSTLSFAWGAQRYLDCYRLLDSYWGQFGNESDSTQSPPTQHTSPAKQAERRGIRKLIRR